MMYFSIYFPCKHSQQFLSASLDSENKTLQECLEVTNILKLQISGLHCVKTQTAFDTLMTLLVYGWEIPDILYDLLFSFHINSI